MKLLTLKAWLEASITPAILCRPNGQILYRNPATRYSDIGPRVGAGLLRYLTPEAAVLFESAVEKDRSAILMLPAGSGIRKMLLLPFVMEEEAIILLLGLSVLQAPDYAPGVLRVRGEQLLGLLGNRRSFTELSPSLNVNPAHLRLADLYAKLLSLSVHDCNFSFNKMQMLSAATVLNRFFAETLLPLGIRLQISLQDSHPRQQYFSYGTEWLTTVLGITICLLAITGEKNASIVLYEQQGRLHFGMELKADESFSGCLKSMGDGTPLLLRIGKEYPAWIAELSALAEICRRHRWIPTAYTLRDSKVYFNLEGEWLSRINYFREEDDFTIADNDYHDFLFELRCI